MPSGYPDNPITETPVSQLLPLGMAGMKRAAQRRELQAIHLELTLEEEREIIRVAIKLAKAGSIRHAEFLFNRKYGLPKISVEAETEHRVYVITSDPGFGGVSESDRQPRMSPVDVEEGDYDISEDTSP